MMTTKANPKHKIAAPGRANKELLFLEENEPEICDIAQRIASSSVFAKVPYATIEQLVKEWFNTGHWWEPSAEELLEFLEGDL